MKPAAQSGSPDSLLANRETRLIGGMFGLARSGSPSGSIPACDLGQVWYFANAHSALFWLVEWLKPGTLWLPSFLCPALVDALRKADCPFKFFAIGFDLQLKDDSWMRTLGPGDLVLYIDYFGFGFELGDVKGTGTWALQNACQACLHALLAAERGLVRRYFYPGCHRMEPYRSRDPDVGLRLPCTERAAARTLCLPTGTAVTPSDIATVCDIVRFAVAHGQDIATRVATSCSAETLA